MTPPVDWSTDGAVIDPDFKVMGSTHRVCKRYVACDCSGVECIEGDDVRVTLRLQPPIRCVHPVNHPVLTVERRSSLHIAQVQQAQLELVPRALQLRIDVDDFRVKLDHLTAT